MKIIATGLSGLIGSRLVELLGSKYQFINFSLETGIDITKKELLEQAFAKHPQASVVLHLAGFTNVDAAWQQRGDKKGLCYQVNVIGTRNIAQICAQKKLYLIHISTDYVFDGKNPPSGGYTEKDKPNPIEWYGQTKYLGEREVEKSGCRFVILRPAFPFKAKSASKNLEPNPKLDLVRKIIHKLQNNKKVFVFHDQIITPTFIDDIALVIDRVIQRQPTGIFHMVGSSHLSPYELAVRINEVFSLNKRTIVRVSIEEFLNQSDRPRQKNLSLSNEKLKKELGVKMKTTDEALKTMKLQL